MFEVEDKVVHPAHGAGVIAGIEEKELLDEYSQYYIIQLTATEMKLMIPVETADEIGLRPVAKPAQVRTIYETLRAKPRDLVNDFKKRQSILTAQLKSGEILEVSEVVRDLFWRNEDSPLSPTESRQLEGAQEQLAGELSLAEDVDVEESLVRVNDTLRESFQQKQLEKQLAAANGAESGVAADS
ncbi:MAG: RNA polymerase-binding transcription factor CarD [Anaerolineales bacterium]|nr:RNA polymerase-binding transcription factor CarD [Anaerolineales bacterium]